MGAGEHERASVEGASFERRAVVAVGAAFPSLLAAHATALGVWRALGRDAMPPAEWVSAGGLTLGLLLGATLPAARRLASRLPDVLDGATRRHTATAVVVSLFALLALVQAGRVTAYLVDGTLTRDAASPMEPGAKGHLCMAAYVQAAELARAGEPNLYAASHYEAFASKDLLELLPPASYRDGIADPMHGKKVRIESEAERDVFGALRCTCGCPRDPANLLSTCACGAAEAARGKVRARMAAGETKEQILVAYVEANGPASLAGSVEGEPATTVRHLGEHLGDAYEYPPPFLVLPRLALGLTNDFHVMRAAWGLLQALAIGGLSFLVARAIGGRAGLAAGLLLPAFWGSMPFLEDLQLGQLHLLTVALAAGGMAAFARRRDVLGGALLGAAIVMKVAPGLLLVVLLARRQWRQAALVGGWMAAYTLLGLVVLGPAPLVAFFGYQLPRIASGAAFAFQLGRPGLLAESFAAYVLPLKLRAFGVPGMTLGVASTVGKAYGAALVAVAVVAARRGTGSRLDDAQRTLALLGLAGLASPIAPYPYAVAGTVWLLTLLAADVRGARDGVLLLAAWVYFAVTLFALDVPPLHELDMLVGPFVTIAFLGWVALRSNAPRLEGDVTHAHPSPTNAAA